jgi:hypothetical protein
LCKVREKKKISIYLITSNINEGKKVNRRTIKKLNHKLFEIFNKVKTRNIWKLLLTEQKVENLTKRQENNENSRHFCNFYFLSDKKFGW